MGAVYEVEHVKLGVRYALKTFTLEDGPVELFRQRFLAEGKVLARLNHPNIARVFDLNYDEDHLIRWFSQMVAALDYIHNEGIIHRDIKLNNILLNESIEYPDEAVDPVALPSKKGLFCLRRSGGDL